MDEPSRADPDLAERLRIAERRRLRALVEADMATADELHADDYELITPGAMTLSKSDYLGGIGAGTLRYDRFEPIGDIAVRTWGTAAALRYRVEIVVVHDGTTYRDLCWHTDIWEVRERAWVAVWSHATRIRPS